MPSAPSAPAALPFAELLDELRRHGFVIGLDQHLRLQLLLDRLAENCPPERLKTHLCPIFATSREEQERFHAAFDRLYPVFADVGLEAERAEAGWPSESLIPPRRVPRRRWVTAAGSVVVLAAVILAAITWQRTGRSVPVPPSVDSVVVPPQPAPQPLPAPVPDSTPAPPSDTGAVAAAPEPETLPEPPAFASWGGFLARHRTTARILLVALPLALFLLNEWRLYRRRRLVVGRQRREKPPFTWPVRIEAPTNPFDESAELPTAARLLRQREAGQVERLAVEESVGATIAALGFPTFRYRTDTRPPEYLVLIERAAHRDHRARLSQSLARALEREGVHTTRYLHDGDPRVCYSEAGDQRELLVDLRRRFPDHRLLLFGSGERLVDQVTGRLHPWTTQLLSWSDRAILTPETPAAWGLRELALAQHFVVLPASIAGLMGVVGHFRGPMRPDVSRWGELDSDPAVPRLDDGDPLPRLQSYLGPRVFRWLCACAVYPELHWDLTLHFGALSVFGPGLITEEHLLRLLRLPWYRQGVIPDEARVRLIDQLTVVEERAVREAIVDLLERNPAPGASVSANRYELDLVVQRLALHRRDPRQRAAALRDLAQFPRRELVQDFAMLKLIEEAPTSRLEVMLPRRLRRVFYRDGVPAFGVRAGVRVGVVAAVITAGVALTGRVPWSPPGPTLVIVPGFDFIPVAITGPAELESPGELRLVVGEQTTLYARESPAERQGNNDYFVFRAPPVTWRGEPAAVVTVDAEGLLTAIAPGRGAVVARTQEGEEARLPLRVLPAEFAIDRDSLLLSPGDLRSLKVIIPSPDRRELATRTAQTFDWSVSDSNVIRMASPGVVEALAPGRTTVTVRGLGHEASIAISVSGGGAAPGEPVTSVTLDERPAVELVLREFARALSAGDLQAMLVLFPGLPGRNRNAYKEVFKRKWVLDTSRWRYLDISVSNGTALARLGGTTVVRDEKGKPIEENPFPRTASLERDQKGWHIVAIDGSELPSPPGPVATGTESGPAELAQLRGLDSLRIRARAGGAAARKAYFAAFNSLLYARTAERILENIRSFPAVRTDSSDYAWSYAQLKAHLITTSYPERSTADFLVPVLEGVWRQGLPPQSDERIRLARAQFTFFAEELARGRNPLPDITDSSAVRKARAFLQQFKSGEQIYQIMQTEAARPGARPFDFERWYLNASQVLTAPHVIPAAFTRQGWRYMQDTVFKQSSRYFQGEDWVLGGEKLSENERYDIVNKIKVRYRDDYARHWRQLLADARVAPFTNISDAARKVKVLGGNTSPLMELINAVSLNTAVDSGMASTIFQPALVVSPPDSMRLIGPYTRPYMRAVQALGTALEAVAKAGPSERDALAQEARNQVAAVKNAAASIQRAFASAPNGVGPDIVRLLQAGLSSIDDLLGKAGPAVDDQPRAAAVAAVALTTPVTSLAIGETTAWTAVPHDSGGRELADRAVVWRSSAPLVATVSGDGHVTALTAGTAEITVDVQGISTSQRVVVTPAAPAPVSGPGAEAQSSYNRARQFEDQNLLAKASDAYRDALRNFPEYAEASIGLTRVAVKLRVFDWAKHLERRSLAGLQQLYPDMPAKDQEAWKRLLQNPSLTRINVEPRDITIELIGPAGAQVSYSLVYTMMMRPNGLQSAVSRYQATFELSRGAWLITTMRGVQ